VKDYSWIGGINPLIFISGLDGDKIFATADLNPRPEPWYLLNMSLSCEGGSLDVSEKIKIA
jgi:hypothetical protein